MKTELVSQSAASLSPWPHRFAVAMVCVTFPLIWVGGLVTTYDAGMAVPDWPGTYGYNLFLYPVSTWLYGPWDLFIEHGHRLLGSAAGLLTIGFNVAVWRSDPRRWMRGLALAALVLVVSQGLLGGIRVLAVDREVAKLHGCVGPAFFAFCAALCVLTSRRWHAVGAPGQEWLREQASERELAGSLFRWSLLAICLVYTQLFLGANLRHIAVTAAPSTYQLIVTLHVAMAAFVFAQMLVLWNQSRRFQRSLRTGVHHKSGSPASSGAGELRQLKLFSLATWMLFLTVLQIGFGCGTWVVKFGWPTFVAETSWTAGFLPVAKSMLQAYTITTHVAIGSLLLAFSSMMAVRSYRLLTTPASEPSSSWLATGVQS